jgi:hypothetical protein
VLPPLGATTFAALHLVGLLAVIQLVAYLTDLAKGIAP